MIKSHRSNIERNKLLVDGKRIDTIKIIRQNEKISNNFKPQVNPRISSPRYCKTMLLSKCAICNSKKVKIY